MNHQTGRTRGVTRRGLLGGSGALLTMAGVSGCQLLSTDPAGGDQTSRRGGSKGVEAPMLARRVRDGDLPPVEQRLPRQPLVVEPVNALGVYGGDWNSVLQGAANVVTLYMTMGYEQLVSWTPSFSEELVPNVAESFEIGADGSQFTFRLREGMRWSDGEPFTADDVMFAWDDVRLNEDLFGGVPYPLTLGGEAPRLEKLDEYTVRFTFPRPHGLFLQFLATPTGGDSICRWPRHYLQEFHPKYNPQVADLAEEEGFEHWQDLFWTKSDMWESKDLPRLHPWILTTAFGETSRVVAERNPYYWKTDPEGSQLPYIDRIVFDIVNSKEVINLKAANGELDMDVHHINLVDKPVLARNRGQGGYTFFDKAPTAMNYMIINLNLTHEDPQLREVFRNRDFRVGLSYAIDRQEMIDVIALGQGEPWQAAPRPESPFYDEQLAKQYTEYDVDQANRHLDRAGNAQRDGDGFRLRHDGERIRFAVDVPINTDLAVDFVAAMELVQEYWRAVGIDMRINSVDRSLFYTRKGANKHDANVWFDKMGLHDAPLNPVWYFPFNFESSYGIPWSNWYLELGEPQEEPPEATRRQMELYDELQSTADEEQRRELFAELLSIAREEFYCIGTILPAQGFGVITERFGNVIDPMPDGWMYPTPGPSRPEQYFIG